jgi:hypothetical protein
MPGKLKGTKNYKKSKLLSAVRKVLPTSSDMWKKAYRRYQLISKGDTERDPEDVKRYFWETMCLKGEKPTGKSAPKPLIIPNHKTYGQIS